MEDGGVPVVRLNSRSIVFLQAKERSMKKWEEKEDWEDEFDARFKWAHTAEGRGYLHDVIGEQSADEVIVKEFIRAVLHDERTELLDRIEDHYWDTLEKEKGVIKMHLYKLILDEVQ